MYNGQWIYKYIIRYNTGMVIIIIYYGFELIFKHTFIHIKCCAHGRLVTQNKITIGKIFYFLK